MSICQGNFADLIGVNATTRDFKGVTATVSFARLVLAFAIEKDLPTFDSNELPPRYVATGLVQRYLDEIFVLLPFFSETDFMVSLSRIYQDGGRYAQPSDHWSVRMVLAISVATTSRYKGDSNHQLALAHVAAALDHVEAVLRPGSISGVQAALLLVQYSMIDPEYFRSWHLIGIAARIMVDLGLHIEPPPETKFTREALDMRRRLFYCVYALDRCISMAYGRPFSFTDDSASVYLPVIAHSTVPHEPGNVTSPQLFLRSLQASLYLFDIRRVQSTFYQMSYASSREEWSTEIAGEYTSSILADIQAWASTVPTALSEKHKHFFTLERLYSQIAALAPSCRISKDKLSRENKTIIFAIVLQYTAKLHSILEHSQWHVFFNMCDILRLNSAARLLIEIMWGGL